MHFKPIPDESKIPNFTKRRIRKSGDTNLLANTQKLLAGFQDEGEDMLVSEMGDLVDALYRSAILVQKTKQAVLLERLRRNSRKKLPTKSKFSF